MERSINNLIGMIEIKHNRVELLGLIFAIDAIAGCSLENTAWHWKILAALILILLTAVLVIGREKQNRQYSLSDPRLAEFFATWYRQDGELIVYCNDLDWIQSKSLTDALLEKALKKKLRLYLRQMGSKVAELKEKNARVYQIPNTCIMEHKFSIIVNEDFKRIICRHKFIDAGKSNDLVQFIETNSTRDPHLIAFAEDVLNQCPQVL